MKQKIRKIIITLFVLYSAFFFIGSTLAPIMAHIKQYDFSAILTSLYMYSCHQQPDRSFWILGYPVALCCRCLGFYIGVFICGLVDIFDRLKMSFKWFIALFVISVIDIYINYGLAERHNTGNVTRFVIGLIMGLLFVSIISYLFKKEWRIKKYED
jgi:uncharacterized membrane protein